MTRLVYVPVTIALARRLRSGSVTGPWLGYAIGPGLQKYLGESDASDPDEAEYAALNLAGVAHLVDPAATGPRLVLAAEVADDLLADRDAAGPGSVTVAELSWAQLSALFADESPAAEAVAAARSAVAGRTVVDALDTAEVTALLERYDLLWYAPEELDALD